MIIDLQNGTIVNRSASFHKTTERGWITTKAMVTSDDANLVAIAICLANENQHFHIGAKTHLIRGFKCKIEQLQLIGYHPIVVCSSIFRPFWLIVWLIFSPALIHRYITMNGLEWMAMSASSILKAVFNISSRMHGNLTNIINNHGCAWPNSNSLTRHKQQAWYWSPSVSKILLPNRISYSVFSNKNKNKFLKLASCYRYLYKYAKAIWEHWWALIIGPPLSRTPKGATSNIIGCRCNKLVCFNHSLYTRHLSDKSTGTPYSHMCGHWRYVQCTLYSTLAVHLVGMCLFRYEIRLFPPIHTIRHLSH